MASRRSGAHHVAVRARLIAQLPDVDLEDLDPRRGQERQPVRPERVVATPPRPKDAAGNANDGRPRNAASCSRAAGWAGRHAVGGIDGREVAAELQRLESEDREAIVMRIWGA